MPMFHGITTSAATTGYCAMTSLVSALIAALSHLLVEGARAISFVLWLLIIHDRSWNRVTMLVRLNSPDDVANGQVIL